jgi:hypothetical protein
MLAIIHFDRRNCHRLLPGCCRIQRQCARHAATYGQPRIIGAASVPPSPEPRTPSAPP